MIVKKRLPTKWRLVVSSLYKDYTLIVTALSSQNAVLKGRKKIRPDEYIIHVDPE